MAKKKEPTHVRGVFERPRGSNCWWINHYVNGKQHREKVGRKSDPLALYEKRKADARRDKKLPERRPRTVVTFRDLAADGVEFARSYLKSFPSYEWKERALREPFGSRPAADITPQEIDRFLTDRCRTPASANRFRAFFSLCYRLGMANGKVTTNPARLVRARKENNGRRRYLSWAEYQRLSTVIRRNFPDQHPAFVVSVYAGMRWEEQFSLTWSQVDLKRRVIRSWGTKDPTGRVQTRARNVQLNSVGLAAIKA